MSIREWMKANDVWSLNVTAMELTPGWRVYAQTDDDRHAGINILEDSPLSDEYFLDRLAQQLRGGVAE